MKKVLFLFLLLVTMSFNVFAITDGAFTYPNFFGVNESERIFISHEVSNSTTGILFLEGVSTNFSPVGDNATCELFITEGEEKDLPYLVQIYNVSILREESNSSDNSRESFQLINDQTLYAWEKTHTQNHTVGDVEDYEICPFIKQQSGSVNLRSFIAYDNGTDINFHYGIPRLLTSSSYDYFCLETVLTHTTNTSINTTQYIGFQCIDCNGDTARLGIDTTSLINISVTFVNDTSSPINETVRNFMIKSFELNALPISESRGVFKFRIPFYYTFELFNQFNETFNTNFDYIYLKENDLSSTTTLSQTGTDLSQTLNVFSTLLSTSTLDTSEVFWDEVDINTTTIKLYEEGNYSITLLTVKSFIVNGWSHEFIKPQYTKSKIETKIIKNLEITNEQNSTVRLAFSEYESNKKGFFLNLIKWIFLIMLLFIGITIGFMTESPIKVIGAVLFIWTLLVKFLGGINL